MKSLITIFFALVTIISYAQNIPFEKEFFSSDKDGLKEAKDNIKEGDKLYEEGVAYYKDAIPFYEKAQNFNPNNAELNYKLGTCYISSIYKYKALDRFVAAEKLDNTVNKDLYYFLGQSYHLDMQFDKAIEAFTKYTKKIQTEDAFTKDPYFDLQYTLDDIKMRINQCYNGKKLIQEPIRVFIDNLGDNINTKYNEYGGVISADESVIIFTARRPNSIGGKIDPQLNENFEDMYISYKNPDESWTNAQNIGEAVNTKDHDAVCGIAADGQKFIIYRGKEGNGDLFESTLTGDEWSKAESFGKKINTDYHENHACYGPDGRTLYFISDKPGGRGGHDIYMSKMDEKDKWGDAVNLGPTINTMYDEEAVFMHPDGKTMYFSSMGHNSMGGLDIFKSKFDEASGTWGQPVNLGYPVNTADNDVFFVLSASGRHGYYTSVGTDSKGGRDLYIITFLGPEKPMYLNTEDNLLASSSAPVRAKVVAPKLEVQEAQLTILKGVITDYLTKAPLEAEIEIVDNASNTVIATFKSNSKTGKYLVSLPAGKNYGIAVKKETYLFHSENFDIPKTAAFQEVEKNIELKQLQVGNKIVLRNIFFDTDKATLRPESTYELERLIKLMTDVPTLKIELGGHTDSQGSDDYNQDLSERRAKAVVDYLTQKGVAADRLKWAGYGEKDPMATNETKEGRQLNRRTEFKVLSL